jgi:hypothetical protein
VIKTHSNLKGCESKAQSNELLINTYGNHTNVSNALMRRYKLEVYQICGGPNYVVHLHCRSDEVLETGSAFLLSELVDNLLSAFVASLQQNHHYQAYQYDQKLINALNKPGC